MVGGFREKEQGRRKGRGDVIISRLAGMLAMV